MDRDVTTLVPLGEVSGVFGLQGWVKVFSSTEPRQGIINYPEWLLIDGKHRSLHILEKGKVHGKGIIAKLAEINDRSKAEMLIGRTIAIERENLPRLAKDEYYWLDLIGMDVFTLTGDRLGVIDTLFATGANDVIVVKGDRERLIPWIREQVIKSVDLDNRRIQVDWDKEF